jgi:hypothetical protein
MLATRNVRDFRGAGIAILNPWEAGAEGPADKDRHDTRRLRAQTAQTLEGIAVATICDSPSIDLRMSTPSVHT